MKDTGKTIKGVKVYTDPERPPNLLYFMPKPKVIPKPISPKEKIKTKEFGEVLAKHYDAVQPLFIVNDGFIKLNPRRTGTLTEVEETE